MSGKKTSPCRLPATASRPWRTSLTASYAVLAACKLVLTAGCTLSMRGALHAQGTSPAASTASAPATSSFVPTTDQPLSAEARRILLQPSSDGEAYRLGRGDVLTVVVAGRTELTGKQIVGPDGNVTLPLIGSVDVAEKTREEAAGAIRQRLLQFYTDPAVTVSVDAYTSNRVLLVGAVERPGTQNFDRQPTLLDVLARGGPVTRAGGTFGGSQFSGTTGTGTKALPDRCTIYRGSQTAINVDVAALAHDGNTLANLRLMRDDVVYVPSPDDRFISILGQVQHPGAQPLERETTLARLLSNAGGLTKEAGANPTLRVIEPGTGKTRLVAFRDLLNPSSTDVPLHSGDILFVPESRFNSVAYIFDKLSPVVNIFTTAAFLSTN